MKVSRALGSLAELIFFVGVLSAPSTNSTSTSNTVSGLLSDGNGERCPPPPRGAKRTGPWEDYIHSMIY